MSLYSIVVHLHSGLRYVALLLLLLAIGICMKRFLRPAIATPFSLKVPLFTLITFHTQLMIGIVLYFISPKVNFSSEMIKSDLLRFFTLEHSVLMLLSVALITIGYSRAKKNKNNRGYQQILIYYLIALLIVLVAIPWPFRHALVAGWF